MKNFLGQSKVKKTTKHFFVVLWFFVFLLAGGIRLAGATSQEVQSALRQQINDIEKQINEYRSSVNSLQQQSNTLKREVAIFDSKIKEVSLEISRTNLVLRQTENELADTNLSLGRAEEKIERERNLLAEYIRTIDRYDQQGLIEIFLVKEKLSDIFDELNSLESVQRGIHESILQIQQSKTDMEQEKINLENKREEFNQLKVLQEIQRRSLASQQAERSALLSQTKGQENNYQTMIKKSQSDITAIKQQLYLLEGVGLSMTLEKAYGYAKRAGDLTGVRPAFLLAVLKKESSWGQKVGTGTWRQDMHKRDQAAFLQICDKLNLDPDKTPVSKKPSYGWGGAMGPAQFLPSVWLQYEAQIASLTGHNPPDPWDIGDAFVAAGVKLAQGGAVAGNADAEWKAAQIYFAGSRWNNPAYYFYGNQVMEMAAVIQSQIDLITR